MTEYNKVIKTNILEECIVTWKKYSQYIIKIIKSVYP